MINDTTKRWLFQKYMEACEDRADSHVWEEEYARAEELCGYYWDIISSLGLSDEYTGFRYGHGDYTLLG